MNKNQFIYKIIHNFHQSIKVKVRRFYREKETKLPCASIEHEEKVLTTNTYMKMLCHQGRIEWCHL